MSERRLTKFAWFPTDCIDGYRGHASQPIYSTVWLTEYVVVQRYREPRYGMGESRGGKYGWVDTNYTIKGSTYWERGSDDKD